MDKSQSKSMDLECGTSLAELEYTTEFDQKQRLYEEKKEDLYSTTTNPSSTKQVTDASQTEKLSTSEKIDLIRSNISNDIVTNGSVSMFTSPFETEKAHNSTGQTDIPESERYASVPLIYCDQTASNRPLRSIEEFIHESCLPLYGNTHTNTSVTGSQSTAFVAEARQIVAEGVNAKISGKAALDVVLFAGNGTTSAVELLVDCLGIKNHESTNDDRPVVFVGPYEHHSNLIPWRESGCEIVMIPECSSTKDVDVKYLEEKLQLPKYKNSIKMGTFTAASNVSGKVCNVNKIAAMLHKYGALAFFDYATGAPYLAMDMNPLPSGEMSAADIAKDAIFISPHKMIGGVNTPGILVLKKHLVNQTNAPSRSGGGTVFYVTHTHHRFLSNRIERYEGGTPNVIGIMRAGLTFLAKRKVEEQYLRSIEADKNEETIPKSIFEYDCWTYSYVVQTLERNAPNIIFLGKEEEVMKNRNLPIFSFLVKCGKRFLHYNYVCAILNDLFGIQSRGGCQCSGPYSQHLLGLTEIVNGREVANQANVSIENALLHYKEKAELLRPGYTRLSLPFKGLCREEVEYVLKALEWVAKHGWALICQYRCNHRTGEWRHFSRQGKPLGRTERRWLSHYDMNCKSKYSSKTSSERELKEVLENAFNNANYQLEIARNEHRFIMQALKMSNDSEILQGDEDLEKLRWYIYPKECAKVLKQGLTVVPDTFSAEILGSIHPLGPNKINSINSIEKGGHSPAENLNDKAKKDVDIEQSNEIKNFPFRDGEDHVGEATFDEIFDGFNDGELSDNCVVFLADEDQWLNIEQFLEKRKKLKNNSDENSTQSMDVDGVEKPAETPTRQAFIPPADKAREKKKPSRDSSSWGKAAPIQALTTPLNAKRNDNTSKNMENKPGQQSYQAGKPNKRKKGNSNHIRPPPKLMKYLIQGIMQFEMIQDGDRLLLGLSGGKDSLTLLHCLLELKRKLPTKFEIEVCTIDPMTPSFDPSPLIPYVESLGLKYHYVKDNIVERAQRGGKNGAIVTSLCAYCARMKRGNLYATARKNSCNKLVLAQHLDDCAESCFMSMMHNGLIRTMKSKYEINAGDLTVIRPLCYCRESLMTEFAKANNLPVINENCPACFEEPKERARVKKLLSREETLYPNIYDNIRRSLIPIMHDDMESILKCYTEEAVSKSRKIKGPGRKIKGFNQNGRPDSEKRDSNNNFDGKGGIKSEGDININGSSESRNSSSKQLSEWSDEELLKEITRRKAHRFRLAGAMKRMDNNEPHDIRKGVCKDPKV